jgi:hypothetical protein
MLIHFLPAFSIWRKLRQPDAVRNSGGQDGRRATDHDSGIGCANVVSRIGSEADADDQHELTAAPFAAAAELALQGRDIREAADMPDRRHAAMLDRRRFRGDIRCDGLFGGSCRNRS